MRIVQRVDLNNDMKFEPDYFLVTIENCKLSTELFFFSLRRTISKWSSRVTSQRHHLLLQSRRKRKKRGRILLMMKSREKVWIVYWPKLEKEEKKEVRKQLQGIREKTVIAPIISAQLLLNNNWLLLHLIMLTISLQAAHISNNTGTKQSLAPRLSKIAREHQSMTAAMVNILTSSLFVRHF